MKSSITFNETTFEFVQIDESNYYNVVINGNSSVYNIRVFHRGNGESVVFLYKGLVDDTNYFNQASLESAEVSTDNIFTLSVMCDFIKSIDRTWVR